MPTLATNWRRIFAPVDRWFARRLPAPDPASVDPVDLYGAAMTTQTNWLHRCLFPRFFRKIHVDPTSLARLKEVTARGTPIYITPDIGQLEYNYLNYLLREERLPLARFVNGLQTRWWQSPRRIAQIWQLRAAERARHNGPLPHPVRSGYFTQLLVSRAPVLIRVKTSLRYDDLFWDDPAEDPLLPLIETQRRDPDPFYLVPLQFVWDRRPTRTEKGFIDLLFGERENPGRWRKFILFWRNYKRRAVVQIGEPIPLLTLVQPLVERSAAEAAREVRRHLLGIIRRERQSTTGPAIKPRHWMIDHVVDAESVQRAVYAAARDTGRAAEDLQHLARKYADEIVADIRYNYLDVAAVILRWVFRNIYDGFVVDEAQLAAVKRAIAEGPVVLVPNHRSHVDFMLLPYVLYIHNMAMPHVAAGLNMAFWPAGPFFRRCGAFFLRRSFKNNPLYRAVFAEYLSRLVREGYCLAFFIEGGRSRTGKSLEPKLGILSMLTQGLREGIAPDLRCIPVTFTYDQVIEQKAYLSELAGGAKLKESGWHLLRLGRYLKRRHGRIYLNFGEPICWSESLRAVAPQCASPTQLTDEQKPLVVQHQAQTIMYAMNRGAVVTPAAIAATSLLVPLKQAVTEAEVIQIANQLLHYLRWKGVQLADRLTTDPERAVREALRKFAAGPTRLIHCHDDFTPICYAIEAHRRIHLDYSKNTMIHFFVSLACLAVILRTHFRRGETEIHLAAIEADYDRCKRLFRREFTFSTRLTTMAHIERILAYIAETGMVQLHGGRLQITAQGADRLRLFAGLLRNFFESYKIAFLAGPQLPKGGIEERALPKFCLRYGSHLHLLGKIRAPEAISQVNLQHAIQCYTELGFLRPETSADRGKMFLVWQADQPEVKMFQESLEEWC